MSKSCLSSQTIHFHLQHIYRIQMELDTRKNESKAQLKQQTIAIEVRVLLILPLHYDN